MIKLQWQDNTNGYGFWRAWINVSNGGISDYILLNYNTSRTTVAVYPSTRAKAQYTISSTAMIDAGTAKWIDWPIGATTADKTDTLLGIATAIRLVSLIGTASMEILSI